MKLKYKSVHGYEVYSFNEFIEIGKKQPDAVIVDGLPISFTYKDIRATYKGKLNINTTHFYNCYFIETHKVEFLFTTGDVLVRDDENDVYPHAIKFFKLSNYTED